METKPSYPAYSNNTSMNTHPLLTHLISLSLPAMDTSTTAKRSLRAALTEQYEARVASTMERVDPNRAKARLVLKEEDMEFEALDGEWDGYKEPLPQESTSYMDAPLLTIRQLMPGSTSDDEEDRELDQSFRADKIESVSYTHLPSPRDRQKSRMPSSA